MREAASRFLILVAVFGLGAPACALAQETSPTTPTAALTPVKVDSNVNGSVPKFCALGEPVVTNTIAENNIRSLTGQLVTIDVLADPATLTTKAASIGLSLDAVCNYAHRLSMTSDNNGLYRQPLAEPEPNGFAGAIPYSMTMDWAGDQTVLEAQADIHGSKQVVALVAEPFVGQVGLTFAVQPGATSKATNTPLLAGQYRDTVRITVEPQ